MRSINPKCTNKESFKYSILISLHYYELNNHPERIRPLNQYLHKYKFNNTEYNKFEWDNPSICLNVFNENNEQIYESINYSNKNAYIKKINNNRYHAIKPDKDQYLKLKELLRSFTHKELTDLILSKVIYSNNWILDLLSLLSHTLFLSLLLVTISFLLIPKFPYPGSDFKLTFLSTSIFCALLIEISSILTFLIYHSYIHKQSFQSDQFSFY